MFRDGWVCRACWKPNKAAETRCYRCKTPREEQIAVAPGSKVEQIDVMYSKRGRLDIEVPVLAYLVSWPLGFDGALGLFGGFLGFTAGGLVAGTDDVPILGMDVGTFLILLSAASMALSALRLFVARSVQRFARWAYVVAIGLTAFGSFPYLFGFLPWTYEAGSLSANLQAFRVWMNLVMFVLAIGLLVASYIRRPVQEKGPASPEPAVAESPATPRPALAVPESVPLKSWERGSDG